MARYIDADKFIAELEQEKTVAIEFEDGVAVYEIEHTMNLIGMQPTADVVPKSEVERLEHILNSYALQYGTVKDQHEVIDKAKSEVAREIFEEIERFLYMHFRFYKEEIGNDDTKYFEGRLELNTQIQNFIAELKKKYI